MDIICKPSYNAIFWRNSPDQEWEQAYLDEVVSAYADEPYTEFDLWQPVKREGTDEILYYVFYCQECHEPVLSVDANHGYKFCPHCGRAVWQEPNE